MKDEFVTYEQALALKELGFDESCLAYWFNTTPPNPEGPCIVYHEKPYNNREIIKNVIREFCWAPLKQQAFRWFRDKHNLLVTIQAMMKDSWLLTIQSTDSTTANGVYNGKRWELDNDEGYVEPKSYEEAEQACLDKLIEICKNK